VTISGNENFKDTVGKLSVQKANIALFNQTITENDIQAVKPVKKSASALLKNIFVPNEIDGSKLSHLFGGKQPKQVTF